MQKQTTHLTLLLFRRIAHPYLKRAMTIRPGIKCRMWSRSVPPEAGRISLRSVQADPGQRVVTGTSQAIIIYTNGSDSNPQWWSGPLPVLKKIILKSHPDLNRFREIRSGKSDPARFRLPAGRNGHNWQDPQRIRHVYCQYIYSPSRLWVNLAAFGLTTYTVHAVGHRYICFSNRHFVAADIPGRISRVSFKQLFQTQHNKTGEISR